MLPYQKPIVLEPKTMPVQASVIWMHGLGASGDNFLDFTSMIQKRQKISTRFILPHAPLQPITVNQGFTMPAWYDIRSPELLKQQDEVGILKSVHYIHYLIEQEIKRGIPSERIVLAGFSQGGVISLSASLSYSQKLGGCLIISSYFADHPQIVSSFKTVNQDLAILWLHGQQDLLVPYQAAKQGVEKIRVFHPKIEFKAYPVSHAISPQAVPEIISWLDAL